MGIVTQRPDGWSLVWIAISPGVDTDELFLGGNSIKRSPQRITIPEFSAAQHHRKKSVGLTTVGLHKLF